MNIFYKSRHYYLAFFLLLSSYCLQGQTEWGVHLSSLNNFFLVYKKKVDKNRYKRISTAFSSIRFSRFPSLNDNQSDVNTTSIQLGCTWGNEKRKEIRDNWKWAYGLQYIASSSLFDQRNRLQVSAEFGIGYLLGIQIPIKDFLYISAEIIPSLTLEADYLRVTDEVLPTQDRWGFDLQGGASLSSVRVGINYIFGSKS